MAPSKTQNLKSCTECHSHNYLSEFSSEGIFIWRICFNHQKNRNFLTAYLVSSWFINSDYT